VSATRSSLLSRIRNLDDRAGWQEFDLIYRPMLAAFARQRGLRQEAAEEIAQQCMTAVVGRINRFKRQKSFRGWLRKMVANKVCDFLRDRVGNIGDGQFIEAHDDRDQPSRLWQREWNRAHVQYVVRGLRSELAEHTLRAFEMYVLQDVPVEQISRQLGMTANQIYVAKNRVIERLRREHTAELLDALYEDDLP
jgi:RNA polymerase sigma factor (sigma-70 family)